MIRFLTLVLMMLMPSAAAAYNVCGTLTYYDMRTNSSNSSGSKFTSSDRFINAPLRWARVYLYDQDGCNDHYLDCHETGNGDDYLGTTVTDSNGDFCFTNIGAGEDVYVRFDYESNIGDVKWGNGLTPVIYSQTIWDISSSIQLDFSATCYGEVSGVCSNAQQASTYGSNKDLADMLATMIDVDQWTTQSNLEPNGHNGTIIGYYGDRPGTATCASLGQSWGYDEFCVQISGAGQNHVVAHEIGHLVHRRYLNSSAALAGSCPGDWIGEGPNMEKCAMSEGWASFFAVAMYFYPTATTPFFRFASRKMEGLTTAGNFVTNGNGGGTAENRECATMDGNPEDQEANIARFFWDLHDDTTLDDNGYDNNPRHTLNELMAVWDNFGPGTEEGEASEGGLNDPNGTNGRNVWDYKAHALFGSQIVTEMSLNCVYGQEQQQL